MNSPIKWLHCQELLTPYITGFKSDIKQPVFVKDTDRSIVGFIRLLNLNTTRFTKDEIYSILFHVSRVQIRLFHWEHSALNLLLSTLTKGYPHTFKIIHNNIRNLLVKQWHLDLDNATLLLSEAKIIRPLCVKVSEYGGSTKSFSGVSYNTTPSAVKSSCLYRNGKYGAAPRISQKKTTPQVTLSVQERVDVLKLQIAEQIKMKLKQPELITPVNNIDDYQYVDVRNRPITPINEFDERKKDGRFWLPEIVTKTTPTPPTSPSQPDSKPVQRMKKRNRGKKRNRHVMIKPVDTFYRRAYYDTSFYYKPMPLLHCQDVFTPIITGYRKNISYYHMGFIRIHDEQVKRMAQLLEKNTTMYNNDEITQLLYQISNLRIRLFEWDINAVEGMLSVILDGAKHTWRNLHMSLKEIVSSLNLDLSNTTAFLSQAKIYRPPCVTITGYEGSTKSSSGIKYSKLTTAKTTCASKKGKPDEDDPYNDRY